MLKKTTLSILEMLIKRQPVLSVCLDAFLSSIEALYACYSKQHKLLVCGNGGSAADSEHIVGELMKGFLLPRKLKRAVQDQFEFMFPEDAAYFIKNLQGSLPALSLVNPIAFNTAFANDQAPNLCFAQQVLGLGNAGDVFLGISTSGYSENVIYAAKVAKIRDLTVLALTGQDGGELEAVADICIKVPETETYRIQEYHVMIYHMLCAAVENEIFGKS